MIINRVTITGADDSADVCRMNELQERYPFVEWGILLSESSTGQARFPSPAMMVQLNAELNLSAHLCGAWVRQVCLGVWTFTEDPACFWPLFKRLQLNFHCYKHLVSKKLFVPRMLESLGDRQVIFQVDGRNKDILDLARDAGVDAVPLFDLSGGAGVLPEQWPVGDGYCGYAGGLSPDNLDEQLSRINEVTQDHQPIWIDVETHVRSDADTLFDLDKVEAFLKIAEPWVKPVLTEG